MLGPLGNGVVDANEDFIVSWQVNGNSPLTKYFISISDESGMQIATEGELDEPFYGTDYAGNVQMFRENLKNIFNLENGKSYTMRIRQYWGGSEDESVEQQSASSFITRGRPVITITNLSSGEALSSKKITIQASYSQAQGETLNWVRWRIAKMPEDWDYLSEPTEMLEDTGPIYGTAQLQYPFDGIFSGNGYCVQCMVQTQSGMEANSDWIGFWGMESGIQIEAQIKACASGGTGVRLTLPEAVSIPGRASENAKIEDGQLILEGAMYNSNAVWSDLQISHPFNFVWKGSTEIYGAPATQIDLYFGKQANARFSESDAESKGIYSISSSGTWRTVACKESIDKLYMALGDSGVAYSEDAKTWTMATIPAALSGNLSALSLCAGYLSERGTVFFLASSATTTAAYTLDGTTWTTVTMEKAVRNVFYADYTLFASYTDGSLGRTGYLPSWGTCSFEGYSGTSPVSGVAYGNGIYVCVREDGTAAYSKDGKSWISTGSIDEYETGGTASGLCFGNGTFVVRFGRYGYYSPNGRDWGTSEDTGGVLGTGNNIVFGGNVFLSGNDGKLSVTMYGNKWRDTTGTASGTWKSGCYDGKQFVFVGTGGKACIFDSYIPFNLSLRSTTICSGEIYADDWFSFLLDGNKMYVCEDGNESLREFSAPLDFGEDSTLTRIQLFSHQECDFVLVSGRNLTEGERVNVLSIGYDGSFPAQFYANFSNGLNGGQYGTTGYDKFSIYRQEGDDESFQHVGDISVEDGNVLIDASAVTGKTYTYHAYGAGQTYSNAVVTDPVHVCGWDWQILACTQDDSGAYHVQKIFRFANNLSSGSVSNNAGPNVLQNFTRYPTVQNSPWNYRSGTLTSLIGYTADGKYYDTKELRDEITALTTSDYALFLKNRKGDVIRIAVSGAIEMETMDNSASQAQTMKLPWTEIAGASDAQIVITKNDGAYLQAIPSPVAGGYCDCGGGASRSFAYPLTVLQSSGTTVYDGSEAKKVVITGGGSGGIVAEDDGNGNITIYG